MPQDGIIIGSINASGGSSYTAGNGLTLNGTEIDLGGPLSLNTQISLNGKTLTIGQLIFNALGLNIPYGALIAFENNAGGAALSLVSDGIPSGNQQAILKQEGGTIAYITDINNAIANALLLSGSNQTVTQKPQFANGLYTGTNENNGAFLGVSQFLSEVTVPADWITGLTGVLLNGQLGNQYSGVQMYEATGGKNNMLHACNENGEHVFMAANYEGLRVSGNGFRGSGSTPTITNLNAATVGTGASVSLSGNNMDGIITLNTGTGITGYGSLFEVNLNGYNFPNMVTPVLGNVLPSGGGTYPNVPVFVNQNTINSFFVNNPVILTASATYQWTYHNGGY